MRNLLIGRLLWVVPTILWVTFFVFMLIDLSPGDVARSLAGDNATELRVQEVREQLRLDEPLPVRYGEWLAGLPTADLGESFLTRRPVVDMLTDALPRTLSVTMLALLASTVVATVLGVLAANRPGGWFDRGVSGIAAAGIAIPSFFLALVLVSELAVKRNIFPAIGYVPLTENPWQWFVHLILPAISLSTVAVGELARQVRGALRDVLEQDYILVANAKGMSSRQILYKHALRNASIPVLTVFGIRFSQLLGGTVIIEQIFALRGVGSMLVTAVQARDIPVVLGVALLTTTMVVVANLMVDLSYGLANPKLRTAT